MENSDPLVTIIVITYNSSKYVIETLESIKSQTYPNLELIVSDDCSSDDTLEICRKWIDYNKKRFFRTELITTEKNTGVPSNCNRSLKKANGVWIKYIAGDDILKVNCITRFVYNALNDNQNNSFIFCNKSYFYSNPTKIITEKISNILELSHKKQLIKYACTRPNIAPFMFVKKETLIKLNGFDETYHLLEDSPLYFKALRNNFFFHLIDENLVYYRLNENSISNSSSSSIVFTNEIIRFNKTNILPFLLSKGLMIHYLKLKSEYNTNFKTYKHFNLKVLDKLAQIERKILYSI